MINILGVKKENTCCPNCKENYFRYEQHGMHVGKYCDKCDKWIKWVSKIDVPDEFRDKLINGNVELPRNIDEHWAKILADEEEDDLPWN